MTESFTSPAAFTTRPTLRGTFGMTSSTHWLATAAAQSVLERGGNACDAAVAGGFVLHVVEPHLNGPGGDMTAIVAAPGQAPEVLAGQGAAPAEATIEHFEGQSLAMIPGAGGLAAAVPAAVDAWLLLLSERGSWELADVLACAIDYARHGHPVVGRVGSVISTVSELFEKHWPTSARLWMPEGRAPAEHELITNPAYAATLERLVAAGTGAADRKARIEAARAEWRDVVGRAAEEFLRQPHRHSTGTDHAGVIRQSDFDGTLARFEPVVSIDFRGVTVAKSGPWGQGPVLLQTLAILDGFDDADIDPSTARGAHHVLEALKLAMADRDAYYGDADDGGPDDGGGAPAVPLDTLLSREYADERRAQIGSSASAEFRPGVVEGFAAYRPPLLTEQQWQAASAGSAPAGAAGEPTVSRGGDTRGDTCHIDVVDQWGTMVAATPSGGWLQSSPAIEELGFCLGTRLQMNWLDPAAPSALRPGRRPRTTLTPTMVLSGGRAVAALGSPGGDQQEQWQLLYLLRTLVGRYTPQQAIDAPALHTTSLAGSFWPRTWEPGGAVVEDRIGAEVIAGLERRGHRVTRAGDWSLGRLCVVGINDDGSYYAAANPRGAQGYAAGR
ncbi:gamma-glutamyltransferase family protein [Arthrobacter castelli]|uniref:gamma-glutamyltransferase family protein n=1 Tax=Arthrobacter castelli TaxID=271431 RepID=UPI000401E608|nr:gamma-glutamyltransferase [Arthrobacter castelli]